MLAPETIKTKTNFIGYYSYYCCVIKYSSVWNYSCRLKELTCDRSLRERSNWLDVQSMNETSAISFKLNGVYLNFRLKVLVNAGQSLLVDDYYSLIHLIDSWKASPAASHFQLCQLLVAQLWVLLGNNDPATTRPSNQSQRLPGARGTQWRKPRLKGLGTGQTVNT